MISNQKYKILVILLIACALTIGGFFGLRHLYERSSEKHCAYMAREINDIGAPEKVCPRVCERHHMEYDSSFSFLSKKLGPECACCADVLGVPDGDRISLPVPPPQPGGQ